ncbi:MAG: precorrin-6A/cobalt-precorrin-6A reductase [Ruminococcus callidus]
MCENLRCGVGEDSGHTGSRRLTEPFQAHCIYAKPPFSQADMEKLLREHQIAVLVSEDSGKRGGVAEKLQQQRPCRFRWC